MLLQENARNTVACQTNEDLYHRIESLFQASGHADLNRVRLDVGQDEVFLVGHVPTYFMKQMAQTLVLSLEEVKQVHNHLTVENGYQ